MYDCLFIFVLMQYIDRYVVGILLLILQEQHNKMVKNYCIIGIQFGAGRGDRRLWQDVCDKLDPLGGKAGGKTFGPSHATLQRRGVQRGEMRGGFLTYF